MINRRNFIIALGASALAARLSTFAQQQGKVWRIGFLGPESASGTRARIDAVRAGLRDFGYEEGKNIVIEFRWAEGNRDRLPELAAELVRLDVDVLVTHAAGVRAAMQATTTIPIVQASIAGDPVANGLVASLARPGGNITGSTLFGTELSAKRIEVIKDAFTHVTQVAALVDPGNRSAGSMLKAMETTARSVKVTLHQFVVRGPHEFDSAFAAMLKKRVDAVVVPDQAIFNINAKAIANLAAKQRRPLIGGVDVAEAGGVIGYGPNLLDLYRRVGYFVDKILKGAKPGVIPMEQPTRIELVVNMKTAKAIGIKFPQTFLQRADRLIE